MVADGSTTVSLWAFDMTATFSFGTTATKLGPGETLQRDLAVPLPLERLSPWGNDLGDGPIELPDPVTSVRFCLGVVSGDPQPSWGPGADGDVVVLDHGSPAVAAQHVLCSDPTPVG